MKKYIISLLCVSGFAALISVIFVLQKQTSDIDYPVVGIIETVNEDAWRDDLQVKIKERAEEAGYSVLLVPSRRSQDSQIEALRSLLIFQVDSIVFSPVIETGWDSVLEEAARVNIPVIAVDKCVQPGTKGLSVHYVGYDYQNIARSMNQYLQNALASSDKEIVELCGTFGSYNSREISKGLRGNENKAGYRIYGNYMRSRGGEIVKGIFRFNENISAIVSYNEAMALGAIDALEDIHMKPGTEVMICLFSGSKLAKNLVKEGKCNYAMICDIDQLAQSTIETVHKLQEHPSSESLTCLVGYEIITREDFLYA
ncbi:substrate-binding domain-containing protein [Ruminococcus sp. OA3]|uniref:substrate-binding domain-containing protein n=1 Tax=Ruminococcus sp. OA3 TaxID=2914164 RepID=UPI001F06CB3B|nr:substrate-binding domain-containing protein [Ruminococcus sp. OA3]MCH1982220.1 substrate-binding domain-containing protein [Ruminococcus sp. OA3]